MLAALVWVALILVSELLTSIKPKVSGNCALTSIALLLDSDWITSTTDN